MTSNERTRAEIFAILDDVERLSAALGLPIEGDDLEVVEIIDRIDRRVADQLARWADGTHA